VTHSIIVGAALISPQGSYWINRREFGPDGAGGPASASVGWVFPAELLGLIRLLGLMVQIKKF